MGASADGAVCWSARQGNAKIKLARTTGSIRCRNPVRYPPGVNGLKLPGPTSGRSLMQIPAAIANTGSGSMACNQSIWDGVPWKDLIGVYGHGISGHGTLSCQTASCPQTAPEVARPVPSAKAPYGITSQRAHVTWRSTAFEDIVHQRDHVGGVNALAAIGVTDARHRQGRNPSLKHVVHQVNDVR